MALASSALIDELRRVRARDTETIALPRFGGGHCDVASALALAVWAKRRVSDASSGAASAGYGSMLTDGTTGEEWLEQRSRPGGRPDPDPSARRARGAQRPPAGWERGPSLKDMDF